MTVPTRTLPTDRHTAKGVRVDRGRSGRNSECLRVPKNQNSQWGGGSAPSGFYFSRKLKFSVCKASSTVGSRRLLLCTHTHGGKQAMGPKMQYRPPNYEPETRRKPQESSSATECHGSHDYWDGDFLGKTRSHSPRVKEKLHYWAIFSSLSQGTKTVFRTDWFKKEVCLSTWTEKNVSFWCAWER